MNNPHVLHELAVAGTISTRHGLYAMRLVFLTCILLSGCGTVTAPIVDLNHAQTPAKLPAKTVARPVVSPPSAGVTYTVVKGDTLFSIAFANGLDYHELASWNNLASPDLIKIGQVLRLSPPVASSPLQSPAQPQPPAAQTMPVKETGIQGSPLPVIVTYTTPQAMRLPWSEANWAKVNGTPPAVQPTQATQPPSQPVEAEVTEQTPPPNTVQADLAASSNGWVWPASGTLLGGFGEGGSKGIDVAGSRGQPILAAADGKVVYSGSGLRGYGLLVIIKHANEYLSAYAHNEKILVHEGEQVKAGQEIAEMGDTDSDRVKLHFEIRQYGKPVDPLTLLPKHT
jgi:lipoprotein NlpD